MKIQKIKTTFLIFSGLIILSFAVFAIAEESSTTNKNIFQDSDQDGLTDAEEKVYGTNPNQADTDGDGYSDGVEIQSGYDPLKPSPGDKIIASEKNTSAVKVAGTSSEKSANLTKELSTKITTLVSQKSADGIKVEDIDSIIEETTGKELTFEDLPEIDEKTIKIKKQDYSKLSEKERAAKEKSDALEYLTAVSYIIGTNSPQKISTTSDAQNLSSQIINAVKAFSFESGDLSYFDNLLGKGKDALTQLQDVEVPEKMLDLHKRGLQLATYLNTLRGEVNIDPADPIKSMVYLSKANGLVSLGNSFIGDVMSSLEEYGINEIPLSL